MRSEKLGKKIRDAETQKTPYMLIVGEKELNADQVTIRRHGKADKQTISVSTLIDDLKQQLSK